jgi:uncharacterized membrane protein
MIDTDPVTEEPGMRIFDREPTLWIAGLNAGIMIIGTVGLKVINQEQAGLFVVVVNAIFAAVNAFAVRPISPVTFTYAIGAIVALMGSYGLNLPTETVAAINMGVVPVLALLSRGQVTPANTAISRESTSEEVAREVGAPGPTAPVA